MSVVQIKHKTTETGLDKKKKVTVSKAYPLEALPLDIIYGSNSRFVRR